MIIINICILYFKYITQLMIFTLNGYPASDDNYKFIIVRIVTGVHPTELLIVLFCRRRYADTSWTLSKTANTDGSGSVRMAKSVTIDTLCHLVSICSCTTKQCYHLVGSVYVDFENVELTLLSK